MSQAQKDISEMLPTPEHALEIRAYEIIEPGVMSHPRDLSSCDVTARESGVPGHRLPHVRLEPVCIP